MDIRPLKAFVQRRFPKRSLLRELILAEDDFISAWVFVASVRLWLRLLDLELMEKVSLIHLSILKELKRRYGRVKVVSDAGKWYPWAAKTLDLEHEVMSGGIRSYVERIIETVKDRLRVFDKYFHCRCSKPEHVSNFLRLFGLYYNHARTHQTLGEPPDPVPGNRI